MTGPDDSRGAWIAVIGDRIEGFEPQDSIDAAIGHSAAALGVPAPALRWMPTAALAANGTAALDGAAAVWCAPGGPFRSLAGAVDGIRWAREAGVPFLGTCAGFQHAVIEFARNVLGHRNASHAEYDDPGDAELFIDELLCSLVGQTMPVSILDPELAAFYGTAEPLERYYCRFGLNPTWRRALDDAGLRVVGVDRQDGDARVLRLAGRPFYVLTLFVPQTSSSAASPHPLVTAYVRAAVDAAPARS